MTAAPGPSAPIGNPAVTRSATASRRRWSLRARLLAWSVTLVAVVCTVVGVVTTVALQSYLYKQLDGSVRGVAGRATHLPPDVGHSGPGPDLSAPTPAQVLGFVTGGGQAPGTLGAILDLKGQVIDGQFSAATQSRDLTGIPFNGAQRAALSGLALDGTPRTVDIPGLGDYRIMRVVSEDGVPLVVGQPAKDVQNTVRKLIVITICVTAGGLVAAGLAGAVTTRYALRPLRRVAATATRVSELRLDRGEVALHDRVPVSDTDPRTEVGQVGAALNRLLGHVGSALEARHASETQVRQFVADASHELRTPLASIRGYAELTRRGGEPIGPDTRHALGRIESEAKRMTTLVEDLLLLARLDAGRPLSYEALDLSPLVVDAVSDARAAGPGHRWRLDLPDDPVLVRADPARLHQVLANLLANARTHTPPDTTVTARVSRHPRGALLEVLDNGPGIPATLLPYVFERFARGEVSRSRTAGSTGLGLAIAHAVVTAHGGRITAESVPGRTVFRVLLPGTADTAAADTAPAESVSAGARPDSQAGDRLTTRS
ncbi:sensor histidine kinase [Streptantibioticus ferralitis]|uniref:histidine kinase n=1 Tax=Streptantibioticus ferralitis TaxID=236510 RepID=A0ABT5Z0N7_9ACTN|nr:HAMP domain-containing sensor histidine kinase [Streptantibioticus ferralitis]MDF2257360.1 HAMP domain-containing sensor histidine kinase [Streptantibioticus ferralitis]